MNVEKGLFMRHPLWLVDSTLFLLFIIAAGFAFFSQQKLPRRVKLEPESVHTTEKKSPAPLVLSHIYENDLFNTYHKVVAPPVMPDYEQKMPQPPTQSPVTIPAEPKQPFLTPLEVKLKGVITIDDESNNIAIIADGKSSEQKNYRVGDMIEDARLIRVLSNRAILIRSNGQQETIYLNKKDIESDPASTEERDHWMHVVKKINNKEFLLDPETFTLITKNIAQLIDLLDLTTVYKKGKSIGCRIGNILHDSLGSAMGLEPYDIITHINDQPVFTTDERYTVYQELLKKSFGDIIKIELVRDNSPSTYTYKLYDLKDPIEDSLHELEKIEASQGIHTGPTPQEVEEERLKLLKDTYKFAPTLQDIKIQQKMAMTKQGKRG
jgi:type II secretion system protein C